MRTRTTLLTLLGLGLAVPSASAQECSGKMYPPGICHAAGSHDAKAGIINIKVSTADQNALPHVSSTEFRNAVMAAIERWNAQANAGYFRYRGLTSETDVDCSQDYNIVRIRAGSGRAVAESRCGGARFRISIRPERPNNGGDFDWRIATDDIAAGGRDLVATLMHELGHGMGLGHPWGATSATAGGGELGDRCDTQNPCCNPYSCITGVCTNGEGSVMAGAFTLTDARRDLYEYDLRCARTIVGDRSATAYRRYVVGGSIQSKSAFSGTWDVTQVSAGRSYKGGSWYWAAAAKTQGDVLWTEGFSTSGTDQVSVEPGPRISLALSTMLWRENNPDTDRVVYASSLDEPVQFDPSSRHAIYQSRSNDRFYGTDSYSPLYHCSSMQWYSRPSNLVCRSTSKIYSVHPIAHAYHDGVDQTVVAWTHQDRDDMDQNGQIMIAVGSAGDSTLSRVQTPGFRSLVGPGLACRDGQAGGRDCVIAYVDPNDTSFRVRVRRFSVSSSLQNWVVTDIQPPVDQEGDTICTGCSSAADLAAFHHNGQFWIVYKSMASGQSLRAVRDSNGTGTWSSAGSLGWAITGPSIIGSTHGNNAIVTLE